MIKWQGKDVIHFFSSSQVKKAASSSAAAAAAPAAATIKQFLLPPLFPLTLSMSVRKAVSQLNVDHSLSKPKEALSGTYARGVQFSQGGIPCIFYSCCKAKIKVQLSSKHKQ